MKMTMKNRHLTAVIMLIDQVFNQKMKIEKKLHLKEIREKFASKALLVDEIRMEAIVSHGGTKEEGIGREHPNYEAAVKEATQLLESPCELFFKPFPMEILNGFMVENIDLEAIEILSGTFKMPEPPAVEEHEPAAMQVMEAEESTEQ